MNRRLLKSGLLIASALAAVSALLPMLSSWSWLADLSSHFRVQYLVGIAIVLTLATVMRAHLAAGILLLALLLHLLPVVSTELRGQSPAVFAGGESYSLVVMNVQAENNTPAALAKHIRHLNADTIVIVELTPDMQEYLQNTIDYPHYFGTALPGANGIGIFSHHAFADSSLPDFGVPHAPAVQVAQTIAGTSLTLVGVHPLAPITPAMYADRNRQFRHIATFAQRQAERETGPLIVAGDFNSTPWSGHFATLLENSGLADGKHGWGLNGTWPGCIPLLSIPIDHALVSSGVQVTDQRTVQVPGSDHCGLLIHLQLNTTGNSE